MVSAIHALELVSPVPYALPPPDLSRRKIGIQRQMTVMGTGYITAVQRLALHFIVADNVVLRQGHRRKPEEQVSYRKQAFSPPCSPISFLYVPPVFSLLFLS